MDKLRKIGPWLWESKERIVLLAMIAVFAHRVWLVANPQDNVPDLPVIQVPRDAVEPTVSAPPLEPTPPPPPPPIADLTRRNMFWVYSRDAAAGDTQQATRQELNLRLENIVRQPDGRVQARMRTNTGYWVEAGDRFETFTLREVNIDEGFVVVFSENLGEEVRLDLP